MQNVPNVQPLSVGCYQERGVFRKLKVYVINCETNAIDTQGNPVQWIQLYTIKIDVFDATSGVSVEWMDRLYPFNYRKRILVPGGQHKDFLIHITSVPYLGWVVVGNVRIENVNHNDILDYFINHLRKQLGSHIFVHRNGYVCLVTTYLDANSNYACESVFSLNSVYPNIGNDWTKDKQSGKVEEEQKRLLGLMFKYYEKDSPGFKTSGSRRYHRFGWNPLVYGGVFEVVDYDFYRLFTKQVVLKEQHCFALYVCVGAKLVVIDECSKDEHHNRSLVQAGGVVVAEYELRFANCTENKAWTLTELLASDAFIDEAFTTDRREKFVLFLGASESQHDSICWTLSVQSSMDEGKHKEIAFTLRMHEGAFIEAVEDWNTGIDEIWARYRYERLFESTVELHGEDYIKVGPDPTIDTKFAVPDDNVCRNILRLGDRIPPINQRHFENLYANIPCLRDRVELPREYYFELFKHLDGAHTRQPNYALYPPTFEDLGYQRQFYWPPFPHLRDVEYHYCILHVKYTHKPQEIRKIIGLKYDEVVFVLIDEHHRVDDAYEWEKCFRWTLLDTADGETRRVGHDGWVYEKSNRVIGRTHTAYYYPLNDLRLGTDITSIEFSDFLYYDVT